MYSDNVEMTCEAKSCVIIVDRCGKAGIACTLTMMR